jgi:hypothetical protein
MGEMCLGFEKEILTAECEKLADTVTGDVRGEVDLMSAHQRSTGMEITTLLTGWFWTQQPVFFQEVFDCLWYVQCKLQQHPQICTSCTRAFQEPRGSPERENAVPVDPAPASSTVTSFCDALGDMYSMMLF